MSKKIVGFLTMMCIVGFVMIMAVPLIILWNEERILRQEKIKLEKIIADLKQTIARLRQERNNLRDENLCITLDY